LGTTTPILGGAKIFSDAEPLDVTQITVILTNPISTVDAFLVYDEAARFLGRAYKDSSAGNRHYTLDFSSSDLIIPYRENFSFYVRAIIKGYKSGGTSGETVALQELEVKGDGVWSHNEYTKATTETYGEYQTARSRLLSISNGGDTTGVVVTGTDLPLGSFRFEGELGDSSADLEVTDLTILAEQAGGVIVSNVSLSAESTTDRHNCSVAGTTITCASIPAMFGSFEDAPRTLTIYGDVVVPDDALNAWLRLKINEPGSVSTAGSMTWTDGDTSFTWVPGGRPIATGTYFSR